MSHFLYNLSQNWSFKSDLNSRLTDLTCSLASFLYLRGLTLCLILSVLSSRTKSKVGKKKKKKERNLLTESEGLGRCGRRDSDGAAPDNDSIKQWMDYKKRGRGTVIFCLP